MIDFKDLEDHIASDGTFDPPAKPKGGPRSTAQYPCAACNGTGRYRGVRVHQEESECFACNGRGYFKSSERERAQRREYERARKLREHDERRAEWESGNPGLAEFLRDAGSWSDFARDLYASLANHGRLTERQTAAAQRMREKVEQRKAERSAAAAEVNLSPISALFDGAVASGFKRPTYRAEGLVLSRAPDHGRNPGAIYVKADSGEYMGKVQGGEYRGKHAAIPALEAIASDPLEAAVRHGRKTGRCSCCGRELTNAESIELGIGPICRSKWGWG